MRAMAMAGDKGSALVELKAVDGAYPAVGELETDPPQPAAADILRRAGRRVRRASSTRRCWRAST